MPTGFRRLGAIDRVLMFEFDERVQDTKAIFCEIATRSPGESVGNLARFPQLEPRSEMQGRGN